MRETKLGPLDVILAGGSDREGGGDGPVVVLLHGYGAPGDDLVGLWRSIRAPREVRWVFPAAPLSLASMGYDADARAWWPIDMVAVERAMRTGVPRDQSGLVPEGLPAARAAVQAMLEALERELAPSSLFLGGFSQGAMLAMDVALHTERALAGLILMSGTLLSEAEWTARMPARAGVPVVLSHGRADPLLPFSLAERLRDHLAAAGLGVDFVPFAGGHTIPSSVLEGVERLLSD